VQAALARLLQGFLHDSHGDVGGTNPQGKNSV
jgi:hypothetical protein